MVSPEGTTFLDSMRNFYHVEASANQAIYRSNPVHFGGAYLRSRLYGGQTVAQMFLVLRKAFPTYFVSSLSVNFTSAGNVTQPVFFKPNSHEPCFCGLQAQQSGKTIASGAARVQKYADIAMNLLFEIHPVDPLHFIGESDELKSDRMWCRITNITDLKDFHFGNEPVAVVILLSDFMVAHPAKIVSTRLQALKQMSGVASLTHKLIFHCAFDDIDPLGFFLVENDVESISQGCAVMKGAIFDENKRLILTFCQQTFISG